MEEKKMVSIVVITYNSSNTILETLESIKNQTYENLELIITDDYSTDDTIMLIKDWIKGNGKRFLDYKIVLSEKNNGITINCNKGIKAASGYYIKTVAGDDLLLETCIEDMVKFCEKEKLELCFSKSLVFTTERDYLYEDKINKLRNKMNYDIFKLENAKEQNNYLIKSFKIDPMGIFYKKSFILKMGLFDENYKMMDDYPFAFKVTKEGYRLKFIDKVEVLYRIRSYEETQKMLKQKRGVNHNNDFKKFQDIELIPIMIEKKMYYSIFILYVERFETYLKSKNNRLYYYLGAILGYLSIDKIKSKLKCLIN